MATKKKSKPKMLTVAMHLPTPPHELHTHCSASWESIKADPATYPSPYPGAQQIEGHLTALGEALQAAQGGSPADKDVVQTEANKVRTDFQILGKYVQSVVRAGPIEDAASRLSKVLMFVSNVGTRPAKPELAIRHGPVSGQVLVIARAQDGALVYYWDHSLDQQTWLAGPQTAQARTSFEGLVPGHTYYFRFRTFKRDGVTTEWSQVVSFMVK